MVTVDTIEGTVDGTLWCHYDMTNDVLYLRLLAERQTATFAEETVDGYLVERAQHCRRVVGLTVVHWWKHFGEDAWPASIHALARATESRARKLAA